MEQKIFMPSGEDVRRMIESAWTDFCQKSGTQGLPPDAISLMKDVFTWGYCTGYNDTLAIIRDQIAINNMASVK